MVGRAAGKIKNNGCYYECRGTLVACGGEGAVGGDFSAFVVIHAFLFERPIGDGAMFGENRVGV